MRVTKTECVMEISYQTEISPTVTFEARNDDEDEVYRGIRLSRADWDALGSPTKITVTVVPGDILNE